MSEQTTVFQLVIEIPPWIRFAKGSIDQHETYTKEEMLRIIDGEVSLNTLRSNGLCCTGKRGYLGKGILIALTRGSFKSEVREQSNEEIRFNRTCDRDSGKPIQTIPTERASMEGRRARRKRLKTKV